MDNSAAKDVWSAVASGWDAGYEWYARNVRPLTEWFCRALAEPGATILDVASGTGQPALALAERVRPAGRVVATDLSPAMTAALERRRRRLGLDNLAVFEMDAQSLRFAERTFDAVSCACGLMFCPDPVAVAREIRRVLVPNGRVAVAVWDEPALNSFFTVAGRALAGVMPPAASDPTAPGAFRLAPAPELLRVLREAGLSGLRIERCAMTFEVASVEEYWQIFIRFAAGVGDKVAALSEQDRVRVRTAMSDGAARFRIGDRLALPATALCAVGVA